MSLTDVLGRMTRRADLYERMVDTLGMREPIARLADAPGVNRRAVTRCMTCDKPGECAQWLDEAEAPREAPAYCRNHDLFERLNKAVRTDS